MMAVLVMASCKGASNKSTLSGAPISITLVAANSANTVSVGQSVVITANVYDQANQGATWMLDPVTFGTLTDITPTSATYTAPTDFTLPTKVTITAMSITNPLVTASMQITASPIQVVIPLLAPQTINAGEQMGLSASVINDTGVNGVTWRLSPATGAGTLIDATPAAATYVAPAVVTTPITVTVTASSVTNPFATSSIEITPLASGAGQNVAAVRVEQGPATGQAHPNAAYTSITICNPSSRTTCQTIDDILVDTGSYGLRILQSQIPLLKLPTLTDGIGNTLDNCASFPDGSYLWGPVAHADINIGTEIASSALVQVISSSNPTVPNGCSNGGTTNLNTPALLGANGILGVGPEPTDCTVAGKNLCDGSLLSTPPNLYYSCPSKGCQAIDNPVVVSRDNQVTNPVTLFADNNGVILQMPPVTDPQISVVGTLTFGIDTAANNALGAATVYTTNEQGYFTTYFNGQTLSASFIDSGAPGIFFPGLMPTCNVSLLFYCPPGPRSLTATMQGVNQNTNTITFGVDNADNLFTTYPGYSVFGTVGGRNGVFDSCANGLGACTFNWGLPFFYGRTVYTAIDGQFPPFGAPPGPWWAY
jgi:Protein of unknown function (DUF3443)